MTEQQINNAMIILAKLYAEQKGFVNPQIIVERKKTQKEKVANV